MKTILSLTAIVCFISVLYVGMKAHNEGELEWLFKSSSSIPGHQTPLEKSLELRHKLPELKGKVQDGGFGYKHPFSGLIAEAEPVGQFYVWSPDNGIEDFKIATAGPRPIDEVPHKTPNDFWVSGVKGGGYRPELARHAGTEAIWVHAQTFIEKNSVIMVYKHKQTGILFGV